MPGNLDPREYEIERQRLDDADAGPWRPATLWCEQCGKVSTDTCVACGDDTELHAA